MKRKIFISVIFSCLCICLVAKEGRQKRDAKDYLPKAGEFAISVSANPLLDYIGNIFNGTEDNELDSFSAESYDPMNVTTLASVAAKYMLTDELGVRANFGWLHMSSTDAYYVQDDAAVALNPFSQAKLIDTRQSKGGGASLYVAAEYRIGKRRVQAIVGAGPYYAFLGSSTKYSYGNAYTELNQSPSTGISNTTSTSQPGFSSVRTLKQYSGTPANFLGIIAFLGIEWFMAPKISLSGEVNVGATYFWTKNTYATSEGFNTLNGTVETWTELISPSSHGFTFGTGNIGANISVSFYF